MNYITTNVRIPEEEYLRLKAEAAQKRKSLAAIIREKIRSKKNEKRSPAQLMRDVRKLAADNSKYLKDVDGVKIIREMRDNAKW